MVVSRDKTPTAQETFVQMAQAAGLRGRLLVTIGLLVLVRLGFKFQFQGLIELLLPKIFKAEEPVALLASSIFLQGADFLRLVSLPSASYLTLMLLLFSNY